MRGVGGDQVADPAEQPAGADPEARRDHEPEEAAQELAVVDLSHAWHDQAEHGGGAGILHGRLLEDTIGGAHRFPVRAGAAASAARRSDSSSARLAAGALGPG